LAGIDYEALAARRITRPADMDVPHRIFVYGAKKRGKTRFASSAGQGSVLIMDPEVGTARMKRINPYVWPIAGWQDVIDQTEWAKRHLDKSDYRWLSYDGMDKIFYFALYCVANIKPSDSISTKQKIIKIQHYGTAADMVKEWLDSLNSLNAGIIITAQEKNEEIKGAVEEDDDVETRDYRKIPNMPAQARSNCLAWADVIGRLYVVKGTVERKVRDREGNVSVIEQEGIKRRLWIHPHESYETGFRSEYGQLPPFLEDPTVPRLVKLLETGRPA
jgi:AAA domain